MTNKYEVKIMPKGDWRGNDPGDRYAVINKAEGFNFSGLYKHSAEFLASHLNKMQNTIEQLEIQLDKAQANQR